VHAPSCEEFRRSYERPRRPVVITGALEGRAALSTWSLEHLAAHGDLVVRVRISERGAPQVFDGDTAASFDLPAMPLRAALARIAEPGGEVWYVQHGDLRRMPELAAEIGSLEYLPPRLASRSLLWVCGPGTINPLHWDTNHVFLAQVRGDKRFVVFPPEDSPKLASLVHRTVWRTTALDLSSVDHARFPDVARTSPWSCTLRPGELLFIPYGWWHYMECDDECVSVSWWWAPSLFAHVRDSARERVASIVQRTLRRVNAQRDRRSATSRASPARRPET
jgi:ribosomal protein L16 Arg81 hydroxylase